jgi:hypothetical protein
MLEVVAVELNLRRPVLVALEEVVLEEERLRLVLLAQQIQVVAEVEYILAAQPAQAAQASLSSLTLVLKEAQAVP